MTERALDRARDPDAFWFASGTAALIAALEAMQAGGKWVAVPPNTCPNVIAAIFGANCKPWFVDIEAGSQGIAPDCLSEVIGGVGAVIAVHAYGNPCKIDRIAEIAEKAGVPLIEDCAQADGATAGGQEVGGFGDIAVFSFGTGKIVDAGGGGLAVVNRARWREPMESAIAAWEASADTTPGAELGNAYRTAYNRFYPAGMAQAQDAFMATVTRLAPAFRKTCRPERIAAIAVQRSGRDASIAARRGKYRMYADLLDRAEHVAAVPLQAGAAPWRFNALVDANRRDTLFKALLAANIKASTWYPRMTGFLPEHAYRAGKLPVAENFERTLLNLWVDDATNHHDVEQSAQFVMQHLRSDA